MQSATLQNGSFTRRQPIQVPSIPPSTAPQIPRPPCQIFGVSARWCGQNAPQSVITW